MTAYVIYQVDEISDPEQLEKYKQAAHPTLQAAGGKILAAYGRQEVVEGESIVGVVVVEFSTFEAAQNWYHSPAYKQATALRLKAASVRAVIVEGR